MENKRKYVLTFTVGFSLASLLIFLAVEFSAQAQSKPTAREIMEKLAENRRVDGSESVMTMVMYNAKGQKRVRKFALITKIYDNGKTEKKLSRFIEPAEVKGTGILTFDYEKKDDDIWLFMPALRKTRRIISSEKSKSFMGSEFSYWDLNIPNLDDFKYKLIKEEKINGIDCWVVELAAKNDDIAEEAGYLKQQLWVGKTDYVPRKGLFYDLDGELLKELSTKDVKLIDRVKKRYRAMFMEMRNEQTRRRSSIRIEKIEVNRAVKDDYFTPRYLERL
jgi:outer membrane lipoprotein-sorting protein